MPGTYDPYEGLDSHLESDYELRFEMQYEPDPDVNDYWDEDPEDWDEADL